MASGQAQGRAQLADVAALAGVSLSTASKVLNRVSTVSVRPETRQRVFDAAAALGYRPHATARALAGAAARTLALLVPELTNPVYSAMIRGAFAEANERGYTVLVAEDFADQRADETYGDLVAAGRVDGLLIASAHQGHPLLGQLEERRIPHVFVNRPVPSSGRNVVVRMADASQLAVSRLHELGHRTVGHIAGPFNTTSGRLRAESFLAAVAEFGMRGRVIHVDFDEAGGAHGAESLMREHPEITGLFCSALSQTVGVVHTLANLGVRIPADMSIVSYDDLPLADYLVPPIDTIAMPLGALGRTAVRALIEQLEGCQPQDMVVPEAPRLVARGSTAPPRRD
jgi:LacI family transcriptional regulator